MSKRNIFISYSYNKSRHIKDIILNKLESMGKVVDYSENTNKKHLSKEEIWKDLLNRIKGSSITIVILSLDLVTDGKGTEGDGFIDSGWVYKELSASLRDYKENRINGVIAVAPNEFYNDIETKFICPECWTEHYFLNEQQLNNIIIENINNVKPEFRSNSSCYRDSLLDDYISIIRLSDFLGNPKHFLNNAWNKRNRQIRRKEFNIVKDLHNNRI